jgi:hypothetical protein
VSLPRAMTETISLLEEVAEFLEGQADVRDGSDGPRPNRAMSLMAEVELTIERLKRDSRLGPVSEEPSEDVLVRMIGAWFEDERSVCDDPDFLRRMRLAYNAMSRGATPQHTKEDV